MLKRYGEKGARAAHVARTSPPLMAITTAQRPGAGLACEQHAARPGHRSERTYNGPI